MNEILLKKYLKLEVIKKIYPLFTTSNAILNCSDFSYDDLGIADTDVVPPPSVASPSTTGRRQSFPPTPGCNVNTNTQEKAFSDMSAGALAGAWGAATASSVLVGALNSFSSSASGESTSDVAYSPTPSALSSLAAGAASDHPVNHTDDSTAEDGIKDHKVRRAPVRVGSKRSLNPGRMERKASREKRRREEVITTVLRVYVSMFASLIASFVQNTKIRLVHRRTVSVHGS